MHAYSVDTLLYRITGIFQYEQMSLEELRLEYYVAGHMGSTTSGRTTCGLFSGKQTTNLGGTRQVATRELTEGKLFGWQNKPLGI